MAGTPRIVLAALVVALIALVFPSGSALAATYHVPDNFPTIQAALDGVADSDTIILRDSTYTGEDNKNLDFKGKAITLRSESGPAGCIIDCEGDGTGVNFFYYGLPADQVLEGISIVNSSESGIYCDDGSSPELRNCVISGNTAYQGGGISCFGSSLTIIDCAISSNVASLHGGGIYCSDSSLSVTNCSISGNEAWVGGGGILCYSSLPEITDCVISGNWGYDYGGGFSSNYSSSVFTNCTIINNETYGVGGGVDTFNSSTSLTNCTIAGNSAPWEDGGGIYSYNSSSTVTHCTISNNVAGWYGGGIYGDSSQATITNCILWNDSVDLGSGPEIALDYGSSFTVSYSDVQGGMADAYVEGGSTLDWQAGNIDAAPLLGGDYHLTPLSPCIDTGTDAGVYTDIDGDTRPQGAGYDMGSDEFRLEFVCPRGHGFWKGHPDMWPVDSLVLGSETYSKEELLLLLGVPIRGDASLILACQLAAAKLNIENGSEPEPIADTIDSADELLASFDGKLPYEIRPFTSIGRSMIQIAYELFKYNSGMLTPDCVSQLTRQ